MNLKIGQEAEVFVKKILDKADIGCELNEDYERRYDCDLDCRIGKKRFTCEVKFDKMAEKTGNIAIEFWNSKADRPSGIKVTTSDIWIHVLSNKKRKTAWAISVGGLKEYLNTHNPKRIVAYGGDNNASLYLYKKEELLKSFVKIDGLKNTELKKVIRSLLK